MAIILLTIVLLGIYATLYIVYTVLLIVCNILRDEKELSESEPTSRFRVVIPAHNEEMYIERILHSLKRQKYPDALYELVVVADNCTDRTAEIAKFNGAVVLERTDEFLRGKGHALGWAFNRLRVGDQDAFFIVDADSIVSENVLSVLDKMIRGGEKIIQCCNGVANPEDSWFTRLMDVSRTIGNQLILPAKQKLGLSSYLMGNGMCFRSDIIMEYGWKAFSVGEDWEYYAKLIHSGEKVAFARTAEVSHQESDSLQQATSQRLRWSSGRFQIAWKYGMKLLLNGIKERNLVKADASFPLIFPNPSLSMNITFLLILASGINYFVFDKHLSFFVWFLMLAVTQVTIFIYGAMFTHNRMNNVLSIFVSPVFLLWKMGIDLLSLVGIGRDGWVPTKRKEKSV